jgi:hypothetical protein
MYFSVLLSFNSVFLRVTTKLYTHEKSADLFLALNFGHQG